MLGTVGSAALLIECCVLTRIEVGAGHGDRVVAFLCYVAGAVFAALCSLIFLTKFTSFFSDVRADLVMVVLGLAAYACCGAGRRLWAAPIADHEHPLTQAAVGLPERSREQVRSRRRADCVRGHR